MTVVMSLFARGVLALVFMIAGVTKLLDVGGTRRMMVDFGLPMRFSPLLAVAIPATEVVLAIALWVPATARVGSGGASLLILLFTAAIAANLLRGHAPTCRCFGQLQSKPAGWGTVTRNGVLAVLALFTLLVSNGTFDYRSLDWSLSWEATVAISLAVGATALLLAGIATAAFLSLMHSYGKVLLRLERMERALAAEGLALGFEAPAREIGLAPGTLAPDMAVIPATGDPTSLVKLWGSGISLMLLFTSRQCGACKALLPLIAKWQREHAEKIRIAIVVNAATDETGLEDILIDSKNEIYAAFQANGTPSAVLIGSDGRIASWVASGSGAITQLLEHTIRASGGHLPIGADLPSLSVPSLEGDTVALASLQGSAAILLFWNASCGFCRAIRDRILAWERSRASASPRLVLVSASDDRSMRDEGFNSLILVDKDAAVSNAFGAGGTPMAVLVSAEGRVASAVMAGADAVFALADQSSERNMSMTLRHKGRSI